MSTDTVFVTGATGYIAQHLVKQLIENGYKVIGTVRSEAKGKQLKLQHPKNLEYVVVPDMGKPGAFDEPLQQHPEVSAFFHTASPFHFSNENVEENILKPALEGTRVALRSAKLHGKNLKKFIVTSSYAAIGFSFLAEPNFPQETIINEDTWTEIPFDMATTNGMLAYVASKPIAEKEVWRFRKEENPDFEVVSINPTYVFGPHAFDEDVKKPLNQSSELINNILAVKSEKDIYEFRGPWIDVRDVAKAHIVALESEKANSQRLILYAGPFSEQSVFNVFDKKFPELNRPKGDPSSLQDTLASAVHGNLNDTKSRSILGFEYTSFDTSLTDSVTQLLKRGFP